MSNQKILETLSELESVLYYRRDGSDDREGVSYEDISKARDLVNEALLLWHRATGCKLA